MDTPTRTTNLPAVSAIDEVVGNVTKDGVQRTRRQSVENLARQLSGTAPLRYLSGVAPIFETEAELLGASITDKVAAWVINDPDVAKVGIWGWNGAAWAWALPLPYEIVPGVDAGAGTANAIQITTRVPVTDGMLVVFPLFRDTTGAPVTVSINGGPVLTLVTNRGNNASGLTTDMEIFGRYSASDQTLRLQNDQDVSALVAQAEAAKAEAVAAAAAAVAAAESISLPPTLTASTIPVTNADGTARVDEPFSAVRGLLDPLLGFAADGVADDTASFEVLEGIIQNHVVDLKRNTYLVTAVPTGNRYENGFHALQRTPPAGSAVKMLHPAPNTLRADTMKLTTGSRYCAWPEYKWHTYNGVIYAMWNEGTAHNANDLHVRMARSYDGADTFTRYERLFQSVSGQQTCWGAGCLDGQQFVVIREIFAGVTNHKLYSRRLYEKRAVTCEIKTVLESNVIELMLPTHGTRPGQSIEFDDTFTIGGVTVAGNTAYVAAANASDTTLKLTIAGSANASSSVTESRTFDIQFIETGFSHIPFGAQTFSEAVIGKGVLLSQPAEYTGLECVSGQGTLYIGVGAGASASFAPGTVGEPIVKVVGVFSTPSIQKVVANGGVSRGDTTVRYLSDGRLMGLCRTNNAGTPKMWFSDDDLGSFTNHWNGPGTTFVQSSMPFFIVNDTWVVASATGNRFGDQESATAVKQGLVPVYLMVGRYDDLKASGWPAFTYYVIGYVFHENKFADNEAPGCGVGSLTLFGDTIILGNSTENYDDLGRPWNNVNGSPDIYCTRLKLGDYIPEFRTTSEALIGQNALAVSRGTNMHTETAYIEEVVGSSAIFGQILVNATTGAAYSTRHLSVNKTTGGTFQVSYDRPLPVNRIYVKAQCYNINGKAKVSLVTSTGFTVTTYNEAGLLTDYDFMAEVSYLHDFARTSWS